MIVTSKAVSDKRLAVFEDLPIPVDYAPIQKYVVLGASDSGKTFMLARFAEQCARAGIFFVILDPVGKHWSLRAGKDGSATGGIADVYVLGGLHGDVPLDPKSGNLTADVVVDHPGRYVVDVSSFDTDTDVHGFATAFAKRLFRRKAKDPGWPLLLMLEESESFLPQQPQPGQQTMKGAFGRIVRQGRNHGLGIFLVFQRAAAGDKGAISQCKVLIVKQMSHKRDRDAIDDWVEANGTKEQRDEMMASLASLRVDEAYVWDPSWMRVFARTRVLARETFDSSANVKHGDRMARVDLVPLDAAALGRQIQAVAERAKAHDPVALRAQIVAERAKVARLEHELAQRPTEPARVEVPTEVPVLDQALVSRLEVALRTFDHSAESIAGDATAVFADQLAERLASPVSDVATAANAVAEALRAHHRPPAVSADSRASQATRPVQGPSPPSASTARPPPVQVDGDGTGIDKGARGLLDALAKRYPVAFTRAQLATLAGRSTRSSSYRPTWRPQRFRCLTHPSPRKR